MYQPSQEWKSPMSPLLTLVSRELDHQLRSFDRHPMERGHHFHFVDVWPQGTTWSAELLSEVLLLIDHHVGRNDVVPVIVIQHPQWHARMQPNASVDLVAELLSAEQDDPPGVYLMNASDFRGIGIATIAGLTAAFESSFPGWSIALQSVRTTDLEHADPTVVIFPRRQSPSTR